MTPNIEKLAARERWERRTSYPLLAAATLQVFSFVYSAGLDVQSPYLVYLDYAIWLMFLGDYSVRLYLSEGARKHFIKTHPLDLLAVLLPALHFLRVISAVVRLLAVSQRGMSERVIAATALITVTVWVVGAAAVREAESAAPDANITTFPDALWWSLVTMTTVGYGDLYPVTINGRFFAGILMITGIGAVGAVTGAVATQLISISKNEDTESKEITDLKATIARVESEAHQDELQTPNA